MFSRSGTYFSMLMVFFVGLDQYANAQNFAWAKRFGGTGAQTLSSSVAVDAGGNVYTTGYFSGTTDFDPGAANFFLTSASLVYTDVFVSKLDVSGNFAWARRIGGTNQSSAYSIVTDGNANVYVTGDFTGTVDFDPGAGIYNLTAAGSGDIFVLKLDAAGNFIWAKQIGGAGADCVSRSAAIDGNGNLFVGGNFSGTADFDPGPSIFFLSSSGNQDALICKIDASGNFIWAKKIGGNLSVARAWSIAAGIDGSIYATGDFYGGNPTDFDPGSGIFNLTPSSSDIFVFRLDASGNFLWAKQMGGSNSEYGEAIAVDANGNVYTTGGFEGTADFDPGNGVYNLTPAVTDIFVSKLDASGNFLWAKQLGGASGDIGYAIALDAIGNVYIAGDFRETADFDPGAGVFNLTAAGIWDMFVCKLSGSGNFAWAVKLGGTADDFSKDLCTDGSGNVYTTGFIYGAGDFDPGTGTFILTPAGSPDVFVTKLASTVTAISGPGNSLVYMDVFPNPVSTKTTLSFSISKSRKLSLYVFDEQGKLIYSGPELFYPAGQHSVDINFPNTSSGVYFLRLIAGDYTETKKIIVVK